MRFPMPDFARSPYVEHGNRAGDPAWVVREDAPQALRIELQKQIDQWERKLIDARRELGYRA